LSWLKHTTLKRLTKYIATKIVFSDENENEMEYYLNDKGEAYIGVGHPEDNPPYSGFITLNKDDVTQLIKVLTEIRDNM
jgi:hypothetical protein